MTKTIGLTDGGDSATDTIGSAGGGSGATISVGNVVIRPIGISPSIGTAPNEDWFRGNQWPPENKEPPNGAPAAWKQNVNKHFTPVTYPNGTNNPFLITLPPRAWDPVWYQIVLLTEFARAWVPTPALDGTLRATMTTALLTANQLKERQELIDLIEFRDNVMNEAVAQMNGFEDYFQGALSYSRATHPCTHLLYLGAMRSAEFAVMHYKNEFQRPRPSQLWPELMPPVQVPGHASFPSGHATQANTAAIVLRAVAAGVVLSIDDITARLAQRIARGREVLGLHYPSDSAGGALLADNVATAYMGCPTVSRLIAAARLEWLAFAV
jgi:membrane-associated phospholipid phosphatase